LGLFKDAEFALAIPDIFFKGDDKFYLLLRDTRGQERHASSNSTVSILSRSTHSTIIISWMARDHVLGH
jgi:hypothetical protein